MRVFTIETTYRIPIYRQRRYEARTLAEACRIAVEDEDWDGSKQDYECAGETYVTGAWPGAVPAYSVPLLAIPSHFGETIQRKADHFAELLAQLSFVAQPMGLSQTDFERWLPHAQAAVGKAQAILAGARDPEDGVGAPGTGSHVLMRLDERDVRAMLGHIFASDPPPGICAADVDNDDVRAGCAAIVAHRDFSDRKRTETLLAALYAICIAAARKHAAR
jgi:hypothetical protein